MYKRIILVMILMVFVQLSMGQTKSESGADPKYIIDPETGRLSMVIRVWGEVKQPGVTMVPSDADLISLLSYVGGPSDRAKLDKIRIIRFNETDGEPRIVYANIERFLETGKDKYIPPIYPNDTIIVPGTVWKVISSYTPFISLAISVLQAWYWIYLINR